MASKPPVAVLDACVLYPFHLRNVLIQAAVDGLFDALWTKDIHEEWIRNLTANAAAVPRERLEATRDKMMAVLPEANVTDYQALISGLDLPDPDDRHVLAAAIAGRASIIVTSNGKDFPAASLQSYGITSLSPDVFLMNLYASFPDALIDSAARARHNLQKSLPAVDAFIDVLARQGLTAFAEILRQRAERLQ